MAFLFEKQTLATIATKLTETTTFLETTTPFTTFEEDTTVLERVINDFVDETTIDSVGEASIGPTLTENELSIPSSSPLALDLQNFVIGNISISLMV